MLGICRHRAMYWSRGIWDLPKSVFEVVSGSKLTVDNWRIRRNPYTWRQSLACLGTKVLIIVSFGRLDCDWIERAGRPRKRKEV